MKRFYWTTDDLERYFLGMLDDAEVADLEKHIAYCPSCATQAQTVADYIDALKILLAEVRAAPRIDFE